MDYEIPNPTLLRIKPTANVLDYGHDLSLPLVLAQSTNVQDLTPSPATFHQTQHDSANPIDELLMFISESDKCLQVHSGNDTNFSTSFLFSPDMVAWIYKQAFTIGFGLKVSAFTSGTVNLGNIKITITQTGNPEKVLLNQTVDAGSANLTATGEQITLFHFDFIQPVELDTGTPLKIDIETQVEETGTNTWQVGFLPCFPTLPTASPKEWIISQIEFHAHASLNHAYPIFRSENNDQRMDYSGCPPQGCNHALENIGSV